MKLRIEGGGELKVVDRSGFCFRATIADARVSGGEGVPASIEVSAQTHTFQDVVAEADRLRADNHALQCQLYDLVADMKDRIDPETGEVLRGIDAFEAGRRAGLGEAIRELRGRGEALRAEALIEEGCAVAYSADLVSALCDRPAPHPPHELQARLDAAEARARELEAELEEMRNVARTRIVEAIRSSPSLGWPADPD